MAIEIALLQLTNLDILMLQAYADAQPLHQYYTDIVNNPYTDLLFTEYVFVTVLPANNANMNISRTVNGITTYITDKIVIQALCHGKYEFGNSIVYFEHGKLHNTNYPTILSFDLEVYYFNGLLHRIQGPAVIYHVTNELEWYAYGQLNNYTGPAIQTDRNSYFYIHGIKLSEKEFMQQLRYQSVIQAVKY